MDENLRRALHALEAGAAEARALSARSVVQTRESLKRTVEDVLSWLEADERAGQGEPESILEQLDRQSKDIAEDLRRADRLMREKTGRE